MEDLIPILVLILFGGLSWVGKMAQRQGKGSSSPNRPPARPHWPGPVAGPGPGAPWPQGNPWPQRPAGQPVAQPARPVSQWPQPVPQQAEVDTEGIGTEGFGTEGQSAMGFGSLADERARFQAEREQFRRSHPEGLLHVRLEEPESIEPVQANPLAAALASKEGLAQAVLLAEVLGKPRALRPFGKR